MATTFSIRDLAKEFDLTTRAMRFYEDMGLLQPERTGPGGRTHLQCEGPHTPQADLACQASRAFAHGSWDIIDLYDSPRDTGVQLQKFLAVLAQHRNSSRNRWPIFRRIWTKSKSMKRKRAPCWPKQRKCRIIDVYVNVNLECA